jgi:hypothetical protein
VEIAIKDEVQHSALLALENIMSIEARYALNEHVDGGIEGYIKQVSLFPLFVLTANNHPPF